MSLPTSPELRDHLIERNLEKTKALRAVQHYLDSLPPDPNNVKRNALALRIALTLKPTRTATGDEAPPDIHDLFEFDLHLCAAKGHGDFTRLLDYASELEFLIKSTGSTKAEVWTDGYQCAQHDLIALEHSDNHTQTENPHESPH